MKINGKELELNKAPYVMGILNVTPDSFSDGGRYNTKELAKKRVEKMIADGVSIIDIGGESTRPGYIKISEQEEIERIAPIIEMIRQEFDIPISVDTYKSKVAEEALKAGAGMINDIWGCKYDEKMAPVIAKYGVPCCIMHNRKEKEYSDFMTDVLNDLQESIEIAEKAGIKRENIILDPGVGFAKTYEQNLIVMKEIQQLRKWNLPILLGTSRKSVIGITLDVPVGERMEGTLATAAYAYMHGNVEFYRVHDVLEHVRFFEMLKAIQYATK